MFLFTLRCFVVGLFGPELLVNALMLAGNGLYITCVSLYMDVYGYIYV